MQEFNLSGEDEVVKIIKGNLQRMFSSSNINLLLGSAFSIAFLKTLSNVELRLSEAVENGNREEEYRVKKEFFDNSILPILNINFESSEFEDNLHLIKTLADIVDLRETSVVHKIINVFTTKVIGKDCDFPENIGIIIETPSFIPYYNGYLNLKLIADIKRVINKQDIHQIMRCVGLDPNDKKHVGKYSLGMRQRLGLAQALMENPNILILDEPFNGLDKDGVVEMHNYLLSLKKDGKTILLASHSSEDINVLCDTVYQIDKGVIERIR